MPATANMVMRGGPRICEIRGWRTKKRRKGHEAGSDGVIERSRTALPLPHGKEPNGAMKGGRTGRRCRRLGPVTRYRQPERLRRPTGESPHRSSGCHGAASMPLDCHEPGRASGSGAEPHSSPPGIAAASSHGPARIPNCSRHARTALPSASTASPSGEPAGLAGAGAGSSARTHRRAAAHSVAARRAPARSHPRTVDGARPRRVAIVRCPCACVLATNAWPITSAPSRRRGTEQASSSTCVVSHPPHRARRGRNRRTPSSIRTSRSRANPQADSGRSQPGQHNRPAARSASRTSGFTVIDNNSGRDPHEHAHKRSTAPDRREGRVGPAPCDAGPPSEPD